MTFLFASLLAGAIELAKWLTEKFGQTITTAFVYILLFACAFIYAYLTSVGFFKGEFFLKWFEIVTVAVGVYELLIKRVAQPILGYK